jgi:hypothetical protein
MTNSQRKTIAPKTRLRIMKRDNFKCVNCGATPALDPGVYLEIDHFVPFSKGGDETDENFRTLCRACNRGKGNDESLNKAPEIDFLNALDRINPQILVTMADHGHATVVANTEEFSDLVSRNRGLDAYTIVVKPNTISGYHAGFNLGIYTLNDNASAKTNFVIAPRE